MVLGPNHKLSFCFPPDLWLLGSEGASLHPGGADLLGGNLGTGTKHRSYWVWEVAWKLFLGTRLLDNLSSSLGQVL